MARRNEVRRCKVEQGKAREIKDMFITKIEKIEEIHTIENIFKGRENAKEI